MPLKLLKEPNSKFDDDDEFVAHYLKQELKNQKRDNSPNSRNMLSSFEKLLSPLSPKSNNSLLVPIKYETK